MLPEFIRVVVAIFGGSLVGRVEDRRGVCGIKSAICWRVIMSELSDVLPEATTGFPVDARCCLMDLVVVVVRIGRRGSEVREDDQAHQF